VIPSPQPSPRWGEGADRDSLQNPGTKKGRALPRVPQRQERGVPKRARGVFRPDSEALERVLGGHQPCFEGFWAVRAPDNSLRHHRLARPKRRSCKGWRPGLDLNQDKERCTALASKLPPPGRIHHRRSHRSRPMLPRINPNVPYVSVERATKVMRQGLWPILNGARVADKPTRASLAVMSASL
jgi:hypothetical protein